MENQEQPALPDANVLRLAHGFKRTFFGLSPTFVSASQQDHYGYLFNNRVRIPFSANNQTLLEKLGKNMLEDSSVAEVSDSTIDSGYTYFGQFVDHDITLDIDSKFEEDRDAKTLVNYRTPNLELDSMYGDGPAIDTFLYDKEGVKLLLGKNSIAVGTIPQTDLDLQRNVNNTAIIGDPRNDENLFVAQLHLSFIKFHNAIVDKLRLANPALHPDELFTKAQFEVRRHYQWVLVHDFLKTIAGADIVDDILTNGLKFFRESRKFFMPVEFSVASYRFGHSMIRNAYHFNKFFPNNDFSWAFIFTKTQVPDNWIVNWKSFFTVDGVPAINKARKIDTRVAFSMSSLPGPGNPPQGSLFATLSSRNLVRSMSLRVPTGQTVAKQMGLTSLTAQQLQSNPFTNPTPAQEQLHQQTIAILNESNSLLLKKTPLWYYILKEAELLSQGNHLGPVGGRIIVEVFVRLLKQTKDSILSDPLWRPQFGLLPGIDPLNYRIVDVLRFAETLNVPGTE
ncbi:heme peroxidase family protein [Spirosoma migulaei]